MTTEKKTVAEQVEMIAGKFNFCIPRKDLEAIQNNPKGRVALKYKKMFIEKLRNITIPNAKEEK